MSDPLFWHRLQFGFTVTYHYLFPQLTMGLALLIVVLKRSACARAARRWNDAARFWIRIFGLNFALGVVTGVPMEFQFGTNWAAFSARAGGVIGQTLAMEGMFAFFLESSFLALLIWGERRLSAPQAPLPRRGRAVRRQLAVGLLHRRHQRLHAAPGRLHHAPRDGTLPGRPGWPTSCSTPGRSRSTCTTRWPRS